MVEKHYCPCCGADNTYSRWLSSLYAPVLAELCVPCGEKEEVEIDRLGTNDIPELLATYQSPK